MSLKYAGVGLMVAAFISLMAIPAMASSQKHKAHGRKACLQDVEKYCSQVEQGKGQIMACLKKNLSTLQPQCQRRLAAKEKRKEMKLACKADKEKYCGQVERGKGRIRTCMKQNRDLLSEQCRTAIGEFKAWRKSQPRAKGSPAGEPLNSWNSIRSTVI